MTKLFSPPEDYKDPFDLEGSSARELLTWLVDKYGWVYNDQGAKVFAGPADRSTPEPPPKTAQELLLNVPYFSQRDSKVPGQWWRSCFSSSVAMLVKVVQPGVLSDSPNADDEHLRRVNEGEGDTTFAWSQIKALKHYGIPAQFRQDLTWDNVDAQLMKGRPVPIGVLIKGHVDSPGGGGHYICVIGKTASGYIVHDPYGEMDLVEGGYIHADGKARHYSRENLTKRFMPGGSGGWGIIAE